MANDFGGYALPNFAFGLRHQRQGPIGVGFYINKSGRNDLTGCIDYLGVARGDIFADFGDAAISDCDISFKAGGA